MTKTKATRTTRRGGMVGLPPVGQGPGDWWQLTGEAFHLCEECTCAASQRVCVLEYLAEHDPTGEQWERHAGWQVFGFLARWECPGCRTTTLDVTDTPTVAKWGRTLGGWSRPAAASSTDAPHVLH